MMRKDLRQEDSLEGFLKILLRGRDFSFADFLWRILKDRKEGKAPDDGGAFSAGL